MAFNPFLLSCFVVSRIGDWFLLDEMGWEFDGFMMDAFSFLFLLMFFCSSFFLARHDLLDDFQRWAFC
jgi:hypothetical protein